MNTERIILETQFFESYQTLSRIESSVFLFIALHIFSYSASFKFTELDKKSNLIVTF